MGDYNQLDFILKHKAEFAGPFLEIGSKDYGSTEDLRSLFPEDEYVGVDLSSGKGVDVVLDFTRPFEEIDAALKGQRFGTIFCLSVLEHCEQPFIMADNLSRLLKEGGMIYVSVPFVFRFHGYPSDYWRFTHEGVKKLFPKLRFDQHEGTVSTCLPGEITPLDDTLGQVQIKKSCSRNVGLLKFIAKIKILKWPLSIIYKLPPTMINMIGVRMEKDSGGHRD